MEKVFTHTENSMREDAVRFNVYIDSIDQQETLQGRSFDFGDEEANAEYVRRFESEEFTSYGIEVMKVCKCCCMWSEVDSIWGIHATCPEEAIKFYKESVI